MKELPLYSESCSFNFLSREPTWIYWYGMLKVSSMGWQFGTFEIYPDRVILKFLSIPIRKIFIIDIEAVETWNSLYGVRIQIFKKKSDSTLIVSTQQLSELSNIFRRFGIKMTVGNERPYWPKVT